MSDSIWGYTEHSSANGKDFRKERRLHHLKCTDFDIWWAARRFSQALIQKNRLLSSITPVNDFKPITPGFRARSWSAVSRWTYRFLREIRNRASTTDAGKRQQTLQRQAYLKLRFLAEEMSGGRWPWRQVRCRLWWSSRVFGVLLFVMSPIVVLIMKSGQWPCVEHLI